MEFLLTVIIPNRNIIDLLQRCLDSLPRRNDIQIIVVDDASEISQEAFAVYRGLDDPVVEVVFSKEAKGAGHARNVGLSRAKGKWLMFVDSDDFLLPSALSLIDEYADSDSDIVYFNIESRYSDTLLPAWRHEKFQKAFANYSVESGQLEKFLRYGYAEPWGKMIRRSLVEAEGCMFEESSVANDYRFSILTGHYAGKIELCRKPLLCVTVRPGSLCFDHFGSDENTMNKLRVFIGVQRFFDDHSIALEPLFRYIRGIRTRKPHLFFSAIKECVSSGYSYLNVIWRCFYGYFYARMKPEDRFC